MRNKVGIIENRQEVEEVRTVRPTHLGRVMPTISATFASIVKQEILAKFPEYRWTVNDGKLIQRAIGTAGFDAAHFSNWLRKLPLETGWKKLYLSRDICLLMYEYMGW